MLRGSALASSLHTRWGRYACEEARTRPKCQRLDQEIARNAELGEQSGRGTSSGPCRWVTLERYARRSPTAYWRA
jgi:hypothetical protein